MKKVTYLFLALLLPGLIFTFLKYGGRNKFDVPVYFEEGVTTGSEPCVLPEGKPYLLPDSLWRLGGVSHTEPLVMIFTQGGVDAKSLESAISEELGIGSVSVLTDGGLTLDSLLVMKWKNCVFMFREPGQAVLVDPEGRIRGYYDIRSREEVDRLRLELKIVLERY